MTISEIIQDYSTGAEYCVQRWLCIGARRALVTNIITIIQANSYHLLAKDVDYGKELVIRFSDIEEITRVL